MLETRSQGDLRRRAAFDLDRNEKGLNRLLSRQFSGVFTQHSIDYAPQKVV